MIQSLTFGQRDSRGVDRHVAHIKHSFPLIQHAYWRAPVICTCEYKNFLKVCKILGFHTSFSDDTGVVGCDSMLMG